jgi:DNA adenine methylase
MGSKNRISKDILPIILKDRKEGQTYVEPFCGGLGTMDKVGGERIASDKNKYLIAMWKGLQENRSRPNIITKDLYSCARDIYNGRELKFEHKMNMDDFMVGWIGWMGSYNGRFFDGGYSGHCVGKTKRDYISEQIRNTEKQLDKIKGIKFISCDYTELEIPSESVIYCDIPYKGTKQYATSKNFDHSLFWDWCRRMSRRGHQVFISEYEAPEDFTCVWQKKVTNSMNTTNTYKPTEKLFKLKQ